MKSSTSQWLTQASLLLFVGVLAGRDIAWDLWLQDGFGFRDTTSALSRGIAYVIFSFALIVSFSMAFITARGDWKNFRTRVSRFPALWRSAAMSLSAGAIYVVTFVVIVEIGAGLFDLIDWGLAPFFTAGIGIVFWKDKVRLPVLAAALTLGLAGLTSLYFLGALGESRAGEEPLLMIVALTSPLLTAVSFSWQRWLLLPDQGGMSRAEVLLVRFGPSLVALTLFALLHYGSLPLLPSSWLELLVAGSLGALPAVLVCFALVLAGLGRFAAWQFAIPTVAFLGTLPAYPEHSDILSLGSALAIVAGVVLFEARGEVEGD